MKKCVAIFYDCLGSIDVNGFMTMTDKEAEDYERLLSEITWEIVYDAYDEELVYSSGEEILSLIEFKDITNEEYKMFERLFGGKFGVFIDAAFLSSIIKQDSRDTDDMDEEEDDYDQMSDDDY
jgi:hypothetical protein